MHSEVLQITSRAGIIYTGQLHSIDTKHSTVTLKKVLITNGFESHSEKLEKHTFDYVIFRGSDIKDVKLCINPRADSLHVEDKAIVHFEFRKSFDQAPKYPKKDFRSREECIDDFNLNYDPAVARMDKLLKNVEPVQSQLTGSVEQITCFNSMKETSPGKNKKSDTTGCANATPSGDNEDISLSIDQNENKSCIRNKPSYLSRKTKCQRAHSSDVFRTSALLTTFKQVRRSHSLSNTKSNTERIGRTFNDVNARVGKFAKYSPNVILKRSTNFSVTRAYDRQRSFFDDFSTNSKRTSQTEETHRRVSPMKFTGFDHRSTSAITMRKANSFTSSFHCNTSFPSSTAYSSYQPTMNMQGEWMVYSHQSPLYRIPISYHQGFVEPVNRIFDSGSLVRTCYYPMI